MTSWRNDAACRGIDVELFYPDVGHAADRLVLKMCAACPVRRACLDEAMDTEMPSYRHGIWGGLSTGQRDRLHRCRTGRCGHPSPVGCRPVLRMAEEVPA